MAPNTVLLKSTSRRWSRSRQSSNGANIVASLFQLEDLPVPAAGQGLPT